MLALLGMTQAAAQEYEYVPFVREGVKWVCDIPYEDIYNMVIRHNYFTLELAGDTVIDGKCYKAMHKYSGDGINWENDTIPIYLREEDKVVFGIVPDGKTYDECPVGIDSDQEMMEKISSGEEFVLYDFNDAVGFIESWCIIPDFNSFVSRKVITDMVAIEGKLSKRYISQCVGDFCLIEGIGFDSLYGGYPLSLQKHKCPVFLDHVIKDNEVIYRSEHHNASTESNPILPIPREGVQWVNERVVIDHGEITRSYYTYEFRGTNFRDYPICYSYQGDTLDMETASRAAVFNMIPGYSEASRSFRTYYISDNPAYDTVLEDGRNLMNFFNPFPGWQPLYKFSYTNSDIEFFNTVNYHINYQCGEFLNRENFFEVDPVEIEGHECRRYAYVGEDGEPIAYIVEGIGFDSRDMGDLLTPFTRKPDPDADYQEYWGLSHVIKDGQIIYKGMRYREDAQAELSGDVDGDGNVTIADVTALIDLLLSGSGPRQLTACDLDGSGSVTIQDVTLLIDKLLSGN